MSNHTKQLTMIPYKKFIKELRNIDPVYSKECTDENKMKKWYKKLQATPEAFRFLARATATNATSMSMQRKLGEDYFHDQVHIFNPYVKLRMTPKAQHGISNSWESFKECHGKLWMKQFSIIDIYIIWDKRSDTLYAVPYWLLFSADWSSFSDNSCVLTPPLLIDHNDIEKGEVELICCVVKTRDHYKHPLHLYNKFEINTSTFPNMDILGHDEDCGGKLGCCSLYRTLSDITFTKTLLKVLKLPFVSFDPRITDAVFKKHFLSMIDLRWNEHHKMRKKEKICAFCNASIQNKTCRCCAKCKFTRYCSSECQREDLKNHRLVCSEMKYARKCLNAAKQTIEDTGGNVHYYPALLIQTFRNISEMNPNTKELCELFTKVSMGGTLPSTRELMAIINRYLNSGHDMDAFCEMLPCLDRMGAPKNLIELFVVINHLVPLIKFADLLKGRSGK